MHQPATKQAQGVITTVTFTFVCAVALAVLRPSPASAAGPDFNDDGFDDLAIGVPFESVGLGSGVQTAGVAHILYGTASGLSADDRQTWHQNSPGVPESADAGDQFGMALAWGDFNGDGFDDLAVGAPGEKLGNRDDAGCVHILYGSAAGLTTSGTQLWHQNKPGIEDVAEPGDLFGWSLAAADFNNDGYTDLAIGVPEEGLGNKTFAGAVHVLLGSPIGLLGVGSAFVHQDTPDIAGAAKKSDHFGWTLVAGDFDGDGLVDLAIGVPQDDISGKKNAGAVNVIFGSLTGLNLSRNQIWHQDKPGIQDECEQSDTFGWSLAAGDFNDDGFADLAVGVSHERVGSDASAGAVNVIYGASAGLVSTGNQFLTQSTLGGGQTPGAADLLGWAIRSGDFNDDGFADLAIGVPLETVGGVDLAGIVQMVYGSGAGLDLAGAQVLSQNTGVVPDSAEQNDWFGAALSCGDYDGDGIDDLAIGAPFEDGIGASERDAGAVFILFGSLGGITDADSQVWTQTDVAESPERDDAMGWSLCGG